MKVYLTEEEAFALEALQARRERINVPGRAANAILKEGLRNLLVAEGLLIVSGGPMVVQAVRARPRPSSAGAEDQSSENHGVRRGARRRRPRNG